MSGTRPLLASFFAHARQRRPGSAGPGTAAGLIETTIPARLDRLGWGRFHTLVVLALGITWILDGLKVTLAGAVAGALRESPTLVLSNAEVGLASSFYLAGAVLGALLFGWLTDRLGRKRLFFITLGVYLVSTASTAFAWDFSSFALFRFLTGAGIGGEYTAIASCIQEFVPARNRASRPCALAARSRLAFCLFHRRGVGSRHSGDAHCDSGVAALADDSRKAG
jgi:MFS family permease